MSEWIVHTGKQPNIRPEVLVDIETIGGEYFRQIARYIDWKNQSNPPVSAVLRYRVVPQIKSIDDAYDHLNSPDIFSYPKTNYVTKTDKELKEAEEKRKEALVETKQAKVEKLFEDITGRKISYDDYMLVKTLEALITMHSK